MPITTLPTEALHRLRRHKLITAEIAEQLPLIHEGVRDGDDLGSTMSYLKLFCPATRETLFVTEWDGEDELYGYCLSPLGPNCDEWGYSSFAELEARQIRQFAGMPAIERDCYWDPQPLRDAVKAEGAEYRPDLLADAR